MAVVSFSLDVECPCDASGMWTALVDWASHGDWIPATRSRILEGDGGTGTLFEAVTEVGRIALIDRMRVVEFDLARLSAEVEKVGPHVTGRAGFTVTSAGAGCTVRWFESVEVRALPSLLVPLAARIGESGFRYALRRLIVRLT